MTQRMEIGLTAGGRHDKKATGRHGGRPPVVTVAGHWLPARGRPQRDRDRHVHMAHAGGRQVTG
jgi:hypothetical protein